MEKALDVVTQGISIRRVALNYGVPKSTLGDRASGLIVPGRNSGPNRIINDEEETKLISFL